MSTELSTEDLVAVARYGGRPGDRGWHRFTATTLDDHTHTVPIIEVPDPSPGVNVFTHTQGVMTGEMSGSYTGINVARVHYATGLITGNVIATGVVTYRGRTGRIEFLASVIGTAEGLTADAIISIAEGDFEGVSGGMHFEGVPAQPLSVVGWLHFPEEG
ncbi:MAG: hypothetical protein L0H96_22885 [Humibacillus sp.]|nr:hypothetical protein [Humibacillus sp.]MDN5779737.1 hypothetical protein [Humibacillus sp.]